MRKFLLMLLLASAGTALHAQELPDFASFKLEKKEDYTAEVDRAVVQTCDFLLAGPNETKDPKRAAAATFLLRWMTGTPAHTFVLDETASKFDDLLVIYLAAMAKQAIENPAESPNSVDFKVKAVKTVLDYCERFDVKLKGTLKKMNEANKQGKLKEYFTG